MQCPASHGPSIPDLRIAMSRLPVTAAFILLLVGCVSTPSGPSSKASDPSPAQTSVVAFSGGRLGAAPGEWEPFIIHRSKEATQYRLVDEHDRPILHARAVGASSGLMQRVSIRPQVTPWLNWQWRIGSVIPGADNFRREGEDSPARIILAFDGDKDKLTFADQIMFETARVLTGQEFPYAMLMYVWENKAPIGTVIDNTRTGRIKMIVAARGSEGIGQWHEFTRNIAEDFEKAFGEKPGQLIGVGILTDTDNTGETVDAWYGDIRLFENASQADRR
jgi:Protein of unknown function (DUF3047)